MSTFPDIIRTNMSVPAGGSVVDKLINFFSHLYTCEGSPNGTVTAPVGSIALDLETGSMYGKASGSGNTGWVAAGGGGGGGGGSSLTPIEKTSAYQLEAGDFVLANGFSGGFTLTLPASPLNGTTVAILKTDATAGIITIEPDDDETISGDADATIISQDAGATFVYDETNNDWVVISTALFGAGADLSTDTLWDAAGDLVVGTGADSAARFAKGTARQYLRVDASAATLEWSTLQTDVRALATPVCRVRNSANISATNNDGTYLTFDTDVLDTDAFHSVASETSKLVVPAGLGGVYHIFAHIFFDANSTGVRSVLFRKNGTTVIAESLLPAAAAPIGTLVTISTIIDLAATDYVEVGVFQNSGGALNVLSDGVRSPVFGMARLGA